MNKILVILLMGANLVASPAMASGTHTVRGYFRSDGTYVAPHVQTNPNSTRLDNWSTKGNVNPYTGQEGTKDPYPQYNQARPYSSPPQTQTYNPTYPQPCRYRVVNGVLICR